MKQYKLKKVYPGLPKTVILGDSVTKAKNGYYQWDKFDGYIIKDAIENNPEYWEEVVEKEWEILEFNSTENSNYNRYIRVGDVYCTIYQTAKLFKSLEELLIGVKSKMYNIQSIQRFSDREIFSIGDEVEGLLESVKITAFKIFNDSIAISIKGAKTVGGTYPLSILKKVSKPKPFITEDGKELTFGESAYEIDDQFRFIGRRLIIRNDSHDKCIPAWSVSSGKLFSTEDIAKNYIIKNKPVFSIKDIEKISYCTSPLIDILRIEAKKIIKL